MGLLEDDGFHRGVFGHWLFRFLFTVSLSSRGFIQGKYRKMKIGQVKFVIMHELFEVPYYLLSNGFWVDKLVYFAYPTLCAFSEFLYPAIYIGSGPRGVLINIHHCSH